MPAAASSPRDLFTPPPWHAGLRAWRPSTLSGVLLASLLVHGILLTVRFVDPESFNRVFQDTPLEVVLVNAKGREPPTKAQAIAQANLAGGGEAAEGRATSPLPPSLTSVDGDTDSEAQKLVQQMQDEQQQLLTQLRRDIARMPVPDPRKPMQTPEEQSQEVRRQQKLRILAEIEKRVNEENARPRKRYISPATREEEYAVYYDALRHAIEARGTRDFPSIAGRKLYGELTMNLTIDAAGRVIAAEVVRPSGSRQLDQRAVAIVHAAGPFGRFSDPMRRKADQIVVTSRFRFTREEGLETTMTTSAP